MSYSELPQFAHNSSQIESDYEIYSPNLIDTAEELVSFRESRFITMLPDDMGDFIIEQIDGDGDGIPDNNDGDGMVDYAERYILESVLKSNPGFYTDKVDWESLIESYDMSGWSVFRSEDGVKLNLVSTHSPQVNLNAAYLNEIIANIENAGIALTPYVTHEDGSGQVYNIEFDWTKDPYLWLYEEEDESIPDGTFPVFDGSDGIPDLGGNVWEEAKHEDFWKGLSPEDWKDIRFLTAAILGVTPNWEMIYEDEIMWGEALSIATGIIASQKEGFDYEMYMNSFPNLDVQAMGERPDVFNSEPNEVVVQGYYLNADLGGLGDTYAIQAMNRENLSYFTGMESERLIEED